MPNDYVANHCLYKNAIFNREYKMTARVWGVSPAVLGYQVGTC